jgi:hypothetical protein
MLLAAANISKIIPHNGLGKSAALASGVPCGGRPRPFRGRTSLRTSMMKHSTETTFDEPVGIVISGGQSSSEVVTRFSAYIWAPAPEEESEAEVQAA